MRTAYVVADDQAREKLLRDIVQGKLAESDSAEVFTQHEHPNGRRFDLIRVRCVAAPELLDEWRARLVPGGRLMVELERGHSKVEMAQAAYIEQLEQLVALQGQQIDNLVRQAELDAAPMTFFQWWRSRK